MSEARRRSRRGGQRRAAAPSRPFWSMGPTDDEHPEPVAEAVTPTAHPTALVESLGPPPFPRGDAAPHYFAAIYERASGMALALATAADLVEWDTPDPGDDADDVGTQGSNR